VKDSFYFCLAEGMGERFFYICLVGCMGERFVLLLSCREYG
jgi:hypothetical protein